MSSRPPKFPIESLLDNDLYKFSMQNAVFSHYKNVEVSYKFNNRGKATHKFSLKCFKLIQNWIFEDLETLRLRQNERKFLEENFKVFGKEYLDFLQEFNFNPKEEVELKFIPVTDKVGKSDMGDIEVLIKGTWERTILYEVVLMALISEAYFSVVDIDWNFEGQEKLAKEKFSVLVNAGCVFSEFGTRRRRCLKIHDLIVRTFAEEASKQSATVKGRFAGTSNVSLAMKYNVPAVGTLAHEWFMAMSVLSRKPPDYLLSLQTVNDDAMTSWRNAYPSSFHTALTDTYTTELFFKYIKGENKQIFNFRHDSGEPLEWLQKFLVWYKEFLKEKQGPVRKTLVFSDSLNSITCIKIQKEVEKANDELRKEYPKYFNDATPLTAIYGVGTYFTNDFKTMSDEKLQSKSLNMVIKLHSCKDKFVVKLSDNKMKHQGEENAVKEVVEQLARLTV